jgi:hypothetical protein
MDGARGPLEETTRGLYLPVFFPTRWTALDSRNGAKESRKGKRKRNTPYIISNTTSLHFFRGYDHFIDRTQWPYCILLVDRLTLTMSFNEFPNSSSMPEMFAVFIAETICWNTS